MSLYQHQDLRGRVALITGASAGIGEACALRFAEAGCKIIIVARREERLESLSQKIAGTYNVPVHKVVLDVRDTSALLALPSSLPDDFKEVDILVANAGLALGTSAAHENSPGEKGCGTTRYCYLHGPIRGLCTSKLLCTSTLLLYAFC